MSALGLGLEGYVTIVTGAEGGIGSAACRRFQEAGAQVIGVDIDPVALEKMAATLPAPIGVRAADLTSTEAVNKLAASVLKEFGHVDVVFNNASITGAVTGLVDYAIEDFDRVMTVNVRSTFLMMQAFLPGMVARGSGSVINMGSTAAVRGTPNLSGYTASKHAVIGLTRATAGEVAASGVRVNALCPGPTMTNMMISFEREIDADDPASVRRSWEAAIPRGKYGEPEELAQAALLLASPLAANITGAVLSADGGATAI